jgi:hypothetical protein
VVCGPDVRPNPGIWTGPRGIQQRLTGWVSRTARLRAPATAGYERPSLGRAVETPPLTWRSAPELREPPRRYVTCVGGQDWVEIVAPPRHPCDPAGPPSGLSDSKACGRWSRRGRAVAITGASKTRYGCSSAVPMAEGPRARDARLRSPAVRPRSTRAAIGAWRRYRCTRQYRCVT